MEALLTKKLILGTAGHIDHGKSTLIRALTGEDPDRLAEEKRRGITIELGFGELSLGDVDFGVVDVPGHERFVRAMVAGATGIDVVMLVVAADEGVMPQTREHLDICSLLGIQAGLVVITKADLVDEDWLELVQDDVRMALEGRFLEEAPMVAVSAETGDGLDSLRNVLKTVGREASAKTRHALMRLPIDRVFEQRGFGPVITGTLASGLLSEGDAVELLPEGHVGRVRGIQNHSHAIPEAIAGQRTAVNLQGIELDHIHRGQVIVHEGALTTTSAFDARVTMLEHLPKPTKHRASFLLHTGTLQVPCKLFLHDREPMQPGSEAFARILADEPVVVLPGDRFILRGFQRLAEHGTTFGGGEVLDPFPTRRKRDPEIFERLALLQEGELEVVLPVLVRDAGPKGCLLQALCQRAGRTQKAADKVLSRLQSQGSVLRYEKEPARLLHVDFFDELSSRLIERLAAFHEAFPTQEGMLREELREQLGIASIRLFSLLLDKLQKQDTIVFEREWARLAGHRVRIPEEEEALRKKIMALISDAAFTPPRAREFADMLGEKAEDIQLAIEHLSKKQQIIRVRDDLYFAAERLLELQEQVLAFFADNEEMTPQDFKAITGASRKFSIPLAEYLDQKKITVRVGEVRKQLLRNG